ncbi:hypothetical protein [Pyruvatibacter sp.]|uniref:hypothetical protein n=1 Tax=Pyruvatibacter sp. TaxID=1981328 RepID=UPI003264C333
MAILHLPFSESQGDGQTSTLSGFWLLFTVFGSVSILVAAYRLFGYWARSLQILADADGLNFVFRNPYDNASLKWSEIGDVTSDHHSKGRRNLAVTKAAGTKVLFEHEKQHPLEVDAAVDAIRIALENHAMPGWSQFGDRAQSEQKLSWMNQIVRAPARAYFSRLVGSVLIAMVWMWIFPPMEFVSHLAAYADNTGGPLLVPLLFLLVPAWALLRIIAAVLGFLLGRIGVYADTSGLAVRNTVFGRPTYVSYARLGSVEVSEGKIVWLAKILLRSAASHRELISTFPMSQSQAHDFARKIRETVASSGTGVAFHANNQSSLSARDSLTG